LVSSVVGSPYHPSVVKLGLQTCRGLVRGSTPRALALLHALRQVVEDYRAPDGKEFKRDFDATVLKPSLDFLDRCCPLTLSMRNVVEVFRQALFNLDAELSDAKVSTR
jgi:translation initiation factor 2B subunit (eIF-2B alpha/beta/delta family)